MYLLILYSTTQLDYGGVLRTASYNTNTALAIALCTSVPSSFESAGKPPFTHQKHVAPTCCASNKMDNTPTIFTTNS